MPHPDIAGLFALLDRWRHLPTYQLERRADIYFGLFLQDALNHHLRPRGLVIDPRIIPEFPIGQTASKRSDKADYFAVSADRSQAFLIELKTDLRSLRANQERYLKEAHARGMAQLLRQVRLMAKAQKPYARQKYYCLLQEIAELGLIELPADLSEKIYGPPRGVNKCIDSIKITSPLPKLQVIHVVPTRKGDMDCIDFETFASIVQSRGDIGNQFARYLRRWARIEAGTAYVTEGQTKAI